MMYTGRMHTSSGIKSCFPASINYFSGLSYLTRGQTGQKLFEILLLQEVRVSSINYTQTLVSSKKQNVLRFDVFSTCDSSFWKCIKKPERTKCLWFLRHFLHSWKVQHDDLTTFLFFSILLYRHNKAMKEI